MTTLEIIAVVIAILCVRENALQEVDYKKSLVLVCHDERYKRNIVQHVDLDFMDRYFNR